MQNAKCRICKQERGVLGIKYGKICCHCFSRLPESIQRNYRILTGRELIYLSKRMAEPDIWGQIGALGIGEKMISINGRGIRLKDLKRISLNFHPFRTGCHAGTVTGRVTIVAELRHPHIVIEEPLFMENITAAYSIKKKDITYQYLGQWAALIEMLQQCLKKRRHTMMPYREKACRIMREYNRKKAQEERTARERREQEAKKRAEESRKKAYAKQEKGADRDCRNDSLRKAEKLYQLKPLYTVKELKEKRRTLLKKYHPDAGGDEEMAKKVNASYEILLKYAAS